MALTRLVIDGYGQVELNNAAFRRDGRIEAQCALDATDFASVPAENGMILAVDNVSRKVYIDAATNSKNGILMLNYSAEHLYDDAYLGLKNFKLTINDGFYPRLGILDIGDKFTTNCVAYDTTEFADEDALATALAAYATTAVYGVPTDTGAIKLTATKAASGLCLQVVKNWDLPDDQPAVQFQVIQL